MQFKRLSIRAVDYGPDKGKVIGELDVEGTAASITVRLKDGVADEILSRCADIIAAAATDQAAAFRAEFLASLNTKKAQS